MSLIDILKAVTIGVAAVGVGAAVGYGTAWVVCTIIDKRELKKQLEAKRKGDFRALIMEKRKNAVDVGIFGKDEDKIEEEVTIESEKGIGNDVYEGMIIECCGY